MLKTLDLSGIDLSLVDADILAKGVTQLEEVGLEDTKLTPQQVTSICTTLTGNSKLKRLNLGFMALSSLNAHILACAITKLEQVHLTKTDLIPEQAEEIFAALDSCIEQESRLKELKIGSNNLSSVDPDVLAKVVNSLEKVNMGKTRLRRKQTTKILTQSLVATNLKELYINQHPKMGKGLYRQACQVIQMIQGRWVDREEGIEEEDSEEEDSEDEDSEDEDSEDEDSEDEDSEDENSEDDEIGD